jgi:hypothetical protein
MSNDKQTEHIPTNAQEADDEQNAQQGSGGLLSKVGDPAGTSLLPSTLLSSLCPFTPSLSSSSPRKENPNTPQAKSSAQPCAPSAHR